MLIIDVSNNSGTSTVVTIKHILFNNLDNLSLKDIIA